MKKCILIGAGDPPQTVDVSSADLVIAVDGGYGYCRRMNIEPHLLVGDFDSFSGEPPHIFTVRATPRKDDTDMILAYREGRERGCSEFHIYGGTGGRLDHTLANLQLLQQLTEQGCRGYLYDGRFTVTALCGGSELRFERGSRGIFSAFSLSGDAEGVTETGFSYPLQDYTLTSSFPLCVSNELIGEPACFTLRRGIAVVMWETNFGKEDRE